MCRIAILERSANRRTAVRYNLRLPVIFHWREGRERTEGGFTSDVGLDGALILSKDCPPIGSEVRVEVLIPSPVTNGDEVRIECIGKVTRVSERRGCRAFCVQGNFDDENLSRRES
jgi:PilZ domain